MEQWRGDILYLEGSADGGEIVEVVGEGGVGVQLLCLV